jgi:hypothetical protein
MKKRKTLSENAASAASHDPTFIQRPVSNHSLEQRNNSISASMSRHSTQTGSEVRQTQQQQICTPPPMNDVGVVPI